MNGHLLAAKPMNIRMLATALQLSPGTVSRSLRSHPDIPNVTRERVVRAAAELGYTPRPWVSRWVSEASTAPPAVRSIGILVGDGYGLHPLSVESSFLAHHFLAAIHGEAQSANVTTSTAFIERADLPKLTTPSHYPPVLRAGRLDGIILIYPFPSGVVEQLARRWPCVSIERHDTRGLIDAVGHGQTAAVCESVTRLHALGHRGIGFVADIHAPGQRLALNERFAGYLAGLGRFGLDYDPARVIGMHGTQLTDEQLPAMIADGVRNGITAWVCALDRQAYLLMRELPAFGIDVPRDVSITGFDDLDIAACSNPPLTTVRVRADLMGSQAADCLIGRIGGAAALRNVELDADLIVRGSTGPPPQQRR